MSGKSRYYLDTIAERVGAIWSIQDEVLQLHIVGEPRREQALIITPQMIIGAPEPLIETKNQRERIVGIRLRIFLDPTLRPGRAFILKSLEMEGVYVCRRVRSQGDNMYDDAFYSEIEAKEILNA